MSPGLLWALSFSRELWCFSAHFLIASKFRHLWTVLKSANGPTCFTHHCPNSPTSAVHITCWRRMSIQCPVDCYYLPVNGHVLSGDHWAWRTDMCFKPLLWIQKGPSPHLRIIFEIEMWGLTEQILWQSISIHYIYMLGEMEKLRLPTHHTMEMMKNLNMREKASTLLFHSFHLPLFNSVIFCFILRNKHWRD